MFFLVKCKLLQIKLNLKMPIEIGYWNLRGLVGFIRLIAEHTGEAVEWVEYDIDNRLGWKYRF